MVELWKGFWTEESGQDLSEYGLLVAFIAFIVLAGVTLFGQNLLTYFNNLASAVSGWAP